MKVLVLNSILYTPNGYVHKVKSIKDTMIYNMCLGFKTNGHSVTLAAAQEYEPTEDKHYDFEILFFKSSFKFIFKPTVLPFSPGLFIYLQRNHKSYDMILSSEVFSFSSLFASIICPTKTVIWHELALHPSLLFKIPSKIWYNLICRFFLRKTFVISRSISARYFISKYCKNVSPVCVEHGINLSKFQFSKEKGDYFTYVGQLISRKNVEYIIETFAQFTKTKCVNCKLLICGDGPLREMLREIAEMKGIKEKVVFMGRQNHLELNDTIKRSKGCLISTKQDNNMVSIPESIVSGTPILSNSVPTNSYLITENGLGLVKDGWGVDELEMLMNNNDEFVDKCIAYRENLSIENSARLLTDIYLNWRNIQ